MWTCKCIFDLWGGICNFNFKLREDGSMCIFEVNPRARAPKRRCVLHVFFEITYTSLGQNHVAIIGYPSTVSYPSYSELQGWLTLAEVGGDLSFDIPKPRVEPTVRALWTFGTFWIFLDAFCTFDMFVVITLLLYDMLWHVMTSGRFQNIPEVRSLQMSSPNFPWTIPRSRTPRLEPCWRRWMQCFPEILGFRKSVWMSEIKNIHRLHGTKKHENNACEPYRSTDTKTRSKNCPGIQVTLETMFLSGDPQAQISSLADSEHCHQIADASWFLVSDISTCPLPCTGDLSETRRPDLVVAEGGPRRKTPALYCWFSRCWLHHNDPYRSCRVHWVWAWFHAAWIAELIQSSWLNVSILFPCLCCYL